MAAHAEEILHDAELFARVDFPHGLAVIGADAMEHAFGAVGVDVVLVDDGAAARAAVVAILVAVVGGIFELPDEFAGIGLEAGEANVAAMAIADEEVAPADNGRAIAVAEALLPDELESLLRPRAGDALLGGHTGAERAEERWPVIRSCLRSTTQNQHQASEPDPSRAHSSLRQITALYGRIGAGGFIVKDGGHDLTSDG